MKDAVNELQALFVEAKNRSEFDFVLTLINYRGIGTKRLATNLHEWFEALEFYKSLYYSLADKEKTRIGVLLYSTFFENSDFYNIIGSLCKIKLGQKGSSYLFWKTKKYERLLGIGEKQDFLLELLDDAEKPSIIEFFENNHHKGIRNTFFHSAYSLSENEYILHDSETVLVGGINRSYVDVHTFLYPSIENVIVFFDVFKKLYEDAFNSYTEDKETTGRFPELVLITILGSENGLKGFRIKNAVNFFGKWHDSGIWHQDDKYDMWVGQNIHLYSQSIESIEIGEQLDRYEGKDIRKNDLEFYNLVDKIKERAVPVEIQRAVYLLLKFGDIRYDKMIAEENFYLKRSYPKMILPFYRKALEIGSQYINVQLLNDRMKELKED
jgi:hypothetical protein